jgi:hypothetical protein
MPVNFRSSTWLGVVILAGLAASVARAEDDAGTRRAQAIQLGHEGTEAYRKGDYALAFEKYEAAYRLVPAPPLVLDLSRTALKLGRCDDALNYALTFSAAFGQSDTASVESPDALVSEVKAQCPEVRITSSPAGAQLAIEGAPAGVSPTTPWKGRLLVGRYTIRARLGGYPEQELELNVAAETAAQLHLTFVAPAAAVRSVAAETPSAAAPTQATSAAAAQSSPAPLQPPAPPLPAPTPSPAPAQPPPAPAGPPAAPPPAPSAASPARETVPREPASSPPSRAVKSIPITGWFKPLPFHRIIDIQLGVAVFPDTFGFCLQTDPIWFLSAEGCVGTVWLVNSLHLDLRFPAFHYLHLIDDRQLDGSHRIHGWEVGVGPLVGVRDVLLVALFLAGTTYVAVDTGVSVEAVYWFSKYVGLKLQLDGGAIVATGKSNPNLPFIEFKIGVAL